MGVRPDMLRTFKDVVSAVSVLDFCFASGSELILGRGSEALCFYLTTLALKIKDSVQTVVVLGFVCFF